MSWEGSSWEKVELAQADRLRYALIVPRLLWPHPNRGAGSELRPEQALALIVGVRLRDLQRYTTEVDGVPRISQMASSPDWAWRFAGAFWARVYEEDPRPLVAAVAEARDSSRRAAATVAAACGLLDFDEIDAGLEILEGALDHDDYVPVDRAWIQAQRARFLREVGRLEEGLEAARIAQDTVRPLSGDPTADAIDAGAASLVNALTDFEKENFAAAMIAGDTVATWWRWHESAVANDRIAQADFERWARDRRVVFGGEDIAGNRLLAAALMSSHAVDQGGWANRVAALGREQLLHLDRHSDSADVTAALGALRRGGDHRAIELAATHLLEAGPATAVAGAAGYVDLEKSTRTTIHADLILLRVAGDVLQPPLAAKFARELLDRIAEPSLLAERTSPGFLLDVQLIESLTGIIGAAGLHGQHAVVGRLPDLPPQDGLAAREWANLIWTLPEDAWTEATARRAAGDAGRHEDVLEQALIGVASRFGNDPAARGRLLEEAIDGSLAAVAEIGDVTKLSEEVADRLIGALSAAVRSRLEEARSGKVSIGGRDPAEALAVLNLWHPAVADWDPLIEVLAGDWVPARYQHRLLVVLAASVDRISPEVRRVLAPLASRLAEDQAVSHAILGEDPDVRGPALDLGIAIGAIDDDVASEMLVAWLSGDEVRRRWAAHAAYRLARREDIGLLIALAADDDPDVRAAAISALAALASGSDGVALAAPVHEVLRRAADDPGVEVPVALAAALVSRTGELAERLRRALRRSISARARSLASRRRGQEGPGINPADSGFQVNPFANPYRKTGGPSGQEETDRDAPTAQ
jgi:hypothetical protein